ARARTLGSTVSSCRSRAGVEHREAAGDGFGEARLDARAAKNPFVGSGHGHAPFSRRVEPYPGGLERSSATISGSTEGWLGFRPGDRRLVRAPQKAAGRLAPHRTKASRG